MLENRQVCSRYLLDSSVPGISFDDKGVCSYCKIHDISDQQHPVDETGQRKLNRIIDEIKSKKIKKMTRIEWVRDVK